MPQNSKNPTALFFNRMANARKGQSGALVDLMTNYFQANYGKTDLPKTAGDFVIFDQVALGGTSTTNYFDGQYTTARSNFPGGSFIAPQSEHMIIMGIRIMDGAGATINAIDWQPGVRDAAAKNAQMKVLMNGQVVSTAIPLTVFDPNQLAATVAGSTDENRGFFFFTEPLVLLGQTQLQIQVQTFSAPAANYSLRIELHGIRFFGN